MKTKLRSQYVPTAGVSLALVIFALWSCCEPTLRAAVIVCASPSPQSQLAAREVQRYVYLRTGTMLAIRDGTLSREDGIVLGKDSALAAEQFRLKTTTTDGYKVLRIDGGSDLATLYGAYRFAETLGVRFELQDDVVPDVPIRFAIPDLDETHAPLFDTRGIQPFHDFTEGPDWWTAGDYKVYFAQMAKLRLNFAGFHCYPEGGVGPEPLVWIGLPEDVNDDGTVNFSYPSRWASTCNGTWGYAAAKTSDFAAGAARLFSQDDFGSPVSDGFRPSPKGPAEANALFNRAGAFLHDTFSFGRLMGVRTCIGTETPLHIPEAVRQHLKEKGLESTNAATVQKLYEGMFKRIARSHPLNDYWLWTPEDWTWGGNKPEQYAATLADIRAAQGALDKLGNPFQLATSGWVLGPQHDRAAFDRDLPKTSPMSCINRQVGFDFVDSAFAQIEGRPKWVIPWLEDDPELVGMQLFSGRVRRDAADAQAYGCTGLLGIHWRTRILSPNFVTLAQAAWDQRGWNPDSGRRIKVEPRTKDVRLGGQVAAFPQNVIAGTDLGAVYQTCVYNVDGYRIRVPNGSYAVTLQFCEVHYAEPGKRVFGVKVQGKPVLEHLDVFARAGKNKALDFTFKDLNVRNEELLIQFVKETEFPFIAGIVIDGRTAKVNQLGDEPFMRKIDCGGPAVASYEADLPAAGSDSGHQGQPRDLPCADFYADWAQAQFGPEVGDAMGKLFTSVDGGAGDYSQNKATRLPRPADWIDGPGGLQSNPRPWAEVRAGYAFVEQIERLRPQVKGAANLERFDYWLN
ncbi:MAG: malectin domain-containing carbohydrate-binding protein, partial [Verrucomicrobia bacterium]|nr:malectin domain-containing carbohydrate-binding protein [Verrucomicrobiota bacterium]